MTDDNPRHLVDNREDFVNLRRFGFSLARALERYRDAVPDRVIALALMIPEGDVERLYQEIVVKLRRLMGVTL